MMPYLKMCEDLKGQVAKLNKDLQDTKDAWCEEAHPLKVDDIIECNGYSHDGKKMRVERLSISDGYAGFRFKAWGRILKKDGSDSTRSGEWFSETLD